MLDPLTIATSSLSLINGITSLTMHIAAFVNDVRGARKDMDLISRELTSLTLCLGALRADCQSQRITYLNSSRRGIEQALMNIDILIQQIKDTLQKLSSGKLGRRIQWTLQSKDTIDRFRSSLETQKSAIEIALQCGSIQILCAIQQQMEAPDGKIGSIKADTEALREDAGILRRDAVDIKKLIQQETETLRSEIISLQGNVGVTTQLQHFLKESQSYSQAIIDALPPATQPSVQPVNMSSVLSPRISATQSHQLPSEIESLRVQYKALTERCSQLQEENLELLSHHELLKRKLAASEAAVQKMHDGKPSEGEEYQAVPHVLRSASDSYFHQGQGGGQPQPAGYNQGYQQQTAVDWFGNPIQQTAVDWFGNPIQQPQSTGYLSNQYAQQPQQTGGGGGYPLSRKSFKTNNPYGASGTESDAVLAARLQREEEARVAGRSISGGGNRGASDSYY